MAGLALIAALALAQQSVAQPAQVGKTPDKLVVYAGVTLIDGAGGPALSDRAIVVENDRIKAVVSSADLGAHAEGAKVVDASGLYALPGLIDTHVHLATSPHRKAAEAMLSRQLYSGVTAARDMAGDARALADLARASRMGEIPAPDIYYAAVMGGASFFEDPRTVASAQGAKPGEAPWMQAITEDTDLPLAIAQARGTSATGIKIYANLSGSLVAKVTAEAHRQGMLVWAHGAVFPASPMQGIEANVDVVSHICMLGYQASNRMPHSYQQQAPVDDAQLAGAQDAKIAAIFREMRRRGTILDATLGIYAFEVPSAPRCASATAVALTAQAYRQGVLISAGTDRSASLQEPYPALHDELEILTDLAGMTNADVIRAATSIAAMTIGRQHEMGTVQAGKLANLVFVSKNPLEDISNLRSVAFTLKRGVIYRRADYSPLVPARESTVPQSSSESERDGG